MFKRMIDLSFSAIGILLLLPLFIVVFVMLSIANDGRPLFFQKRAGKKGRIFTVIKFKTMNDKTGNDGNLLSDAERLTKIGAFIRRTSLDEIPQLFNIFKGDMSLIGPRPLLPEYLPYYTPEQQRRHEVRPGITGLAQINGRNMLKFSERFLLDVEYVNTVSFILDCKIFWKTIFKTGSKGVVHGQTVDEVDDLGISKGLAANHFKR